MGDLRYLSSSSWETDTRIYAKADLQAFKITPQKALIQEIHAELGGLSLGKVVTIEAFKLVHAAKARLC